MDILKIKTKPIYGRNLNDMKDKIKNILVQELDRVYCDNCGAEDEDQCEGCNRKSMNWTLSESAASDIADKIIMIDAKDSQSKETIYVSHGNDGDDDVLCAFTNKQRGLKDCDESGAVLTKTTLHRG